MRQYTQNAAILLKNQEMQEPVCESFKLFRAL